MSVNIKNPIYSLGKMVLIAFIYNGGRDAPARRVRDLAEEAVRYASRHAVNTRESYASHPDADQDSVNELYAVCEDVLSEGAIFKYLVDQVVTIEEKRRQDA